MNDNDLIRITPSPRQLALQRMEFYAFVHFTVNTFTDREWGDGTEDPSPAEEDHGAESLLARCDDFFLPKESSLPPEITLHFPVPPKAELPGASGASALKSAHRALRGFYEAGELLDSCRPGHYRRQQKNPPAGGPCCFLPDASDHRFPGCSGPGGALGLRRRLKACHWHGNTSGLFKANQSPPLHRSSPQAIHSDCPPAFCCIRP